MITIARIVSWLALAGTIGPALLYFTGRTPLDAAKGWMLLATIVWFATAPVWMERRRG